jgi:hypothetical protein
MKYRMRRALPAAALLVGLSLGIEAAAAQSLGEVARKEAERRQQAQSGRAYTNTDLLAGDPPAPPPQTPSPASPAEAEDTKKSAAATENTPEGQNSEAPAAAVLKPRDTRPEAYWRTRAQTLRTELAEGERNVAQTEIRLKELDASPQGPAIVRERGITAKKLAELQATVQYRRDAISRFEAFAQTQKVPADWIR